MLSPRMVITSVPSAPQAFFHAAPSLCGCQLSALLYTNPPDGNSACGTASFVLGKVQLEGLCWVLLTNSAEHTKGAGTLALCASA